MSPSMAAVPRLPEDSLRSALDAPADVIAGLSRSRGFKEIPVWLLYDEVGSRLYQAITACADYYPFRAERQLLEQHAAEVADLVPPGALLVELGCGSAAKTALLLRQLAQRWPVVGYCAVDISAEALHQAQATLQQLDGVIQFEAFNLDYLQGLAAVRHAHPDALLCVLWLGSSVGNLDPQVAARLLKDIGRVAGLRFTLLLGADLWKRTDVLRRAYDDAAGHTARFIINGMQHALRLLGRPEAPESSLWQFSVDVNQQLHQARCSKVEMYVSPRTDLSGVLPGVDILAGERILVEVSRKFSPLSVSSLALRSGLCLQAAWASSEFGLHMLASPAHALECCWAETDGFFDSIADWTAKPIPLRHPFFFYYGHVAAFAKNKLRPDDSAASMDVMFSRGIDPMVLDPGLICHTHPDIPMRWPPVAEVVQYAKQIRALLLPLAERGELSMDALTMCLEHERIHVETLCYMLAQQRKLDWLAGRRPKVLAPDSPLGPAGSPAPPLPPSFLRQCTYASTAVQLDGATTLQELNGCRLPVPDGRHFVAIPGGDVSLGVDPACRVTAFLWDNELGQSGAVVAPFAIASQPVTVAEFALFTFAAKGYSKRQLWSEADWRYLSTSGQRMPATWSFSEEDGMMVHMPEGSYPVAQVASSPVYCSLAEAAAFSKFSAARIMTEAEYVRAIGLGPASLARSLETGGWEWTSTPLGPFQGFRPEPLYPQYSEEFFDGAHYVLRGSCPYTHPSARRRSFRNFYQSQYPYVFAKFRLVKN